MRSFGSDNHSGIHPDILAAIAAANEGHAVAYGDDPATARVTGLIKDLFGSGCDPYFVFNGTGANVLAIKTLVRSHQAVICPSTAHIWTDECGAPEHHAGCKLIPVDTPDGKLTPELVAPHLHDFGFQHHSQPRMISISQPTELGALYTPAEIEALAGLAHANGMALHVDGARLANALAATGLTPRDMITATGVDVLSLGGAKNGLMVGEVVVFMDRTLSAESVYLRKQSAQLASKMRFVAAQFEAYFTGGLWLELAAHSNAMASLLAAGLARFPEVECIYPVQANAVFARLPRHAITKLHEKYFFYVWDDERNLVRWMTSFDTTAQDVDGFLAALGESLR